ncbi:MAG: response regulator [Candidatus Omnitrophica bacterium]|nr:response regulator [Candidatus Omnitrophota bacterium]
MADKIKKILIIDDEEDFSFFVGRNLEREGQFKVISANNGQQGLDLAKQEEVELILLDIMMPGINGFDVLARLKEDPKTKAIPVIMLTGKDDQKSMEIAAKLQNADYIIKPVEIDYLRFRIEQVIQNSQNRIT